MASKFILCSAAAFVIALALRLANAPLHEISPIDELYHLKRMTHFVELDPDRGVGGAFCPWPPLYDRAAGALARLGGATTKEEVLARVIWFPPVAFALFVALSVVGMERRFGRIVALAAGAALAASPFTVTLSWVGSIDHHWLEPVFVVAILAGVLRVILSRPSSLSLLRTGFDGEGAPASRGSLAEPVLSERGARVEGLGMTLGLLLTAAMFVQTALLITAALAFVVLFLTTDGVAGAIAFSIGAAAIALYRLTRPPGYPDNAWFLGWTHAALFAAAAVALATLAWRGRTPRARMFALLAGAAVLLATPTAPAALLGGSRFFGGERWLETIVEFQPLWKARGEDLASILTGLGAGALLVWPLAVRAWRERDACRGTVAAFAILYLLLTISSRRFWSIGIPLLAIAGALEAAAIRQRALRAAAIVAVALVPPIQFALWMLQPSPPPAAAFRPWLHAARFLQTQPAGRLLAPWSVGHLLDVTGERAVVIDNFGTMPDETTFERAHDAFLTTHEESLARYCDESGIRFIAYENPATMRSAAVIVGVDPAAYAGTKLARATVWSRAYHGAPLREFRRVYARDGVVIVERR
jgi:hypothetical protein